MGAACVARGGHGKARNQGGLTCALCVRARARTACAARIGPRARARARARLARVISARQTSAEESTRVPSEGSVAAARGVRRRAHGCMAHRAAPRAARREPGVAAARTWRILSSVKRFAPRKAGESAAPVSLEARSWAGERGVVVSGLTCAACLKSVISVRDERSEVKLRMVTNGVGSSRSASDRVCFRGSRRADRAAKVLVFFVPDRNGLTSCAGGETSRARGRSRLTSK